MAEVVFLALISMHAGERGMGEYDRLSSFVRDELISKVPLSYDAMRSTLVKDEDSDDFLVQLDSELANINSIDEIYELYEDARNILVETPLAEDEVPDFMHMTTAIGALVHRLVIEFETMSFYETIVFFEKFLAFLTNSECAREFTELPLVVGSTLDDIVYSLEGFKLSIDE